MLWLTIQWWITRCELAREGWNGRRASPHPPNYWMGKTPRRGSDDSSDWCMTLQLCKQKCKHPSTHRPAWCMTSLVTLGLTQMLKSLQDLSIWWDVGCLGMSPCLSCSILNFCSYLFTCLVGCTTTVVLIARVGCFQKLGLIVYKRNYCMTRLDYAYSFCLWLVATTRAWPLSLWARLISVVMLW
jgi:hypothetical protein